jgi:aldose 1-epimerase
VKGSAFDFTSEKKLSEGILNIEGGGQQGIDHCFVVTEAVSAEGVYNYDPAVQKRDKSTYLRHIATFTDAVSGRRMTVRGTQPGVQVYTANFLSQDSAAYPFLQHNGMCLETNHFPDSPNNPSFPTTILRPTDEPYFHQTVHSFSTV